MFLKVNYRNYNKTLQLFVIILIAKWVIQLIVWDVTKVTNYVQRD